MQIAHFYHRHGMHRLAKHSDFSYFEFGIWLHTFAFSLVSIFVPILLLKSGNGISAVMIYYLLFNAIDIPLNFLAQNLIIKIGARRVVILGTVAAIAFFGLLSILPPNNWPLLFLLAIVAALYDTLFWVSHMYLFIEASRDKRDTGVAVGSLVGIRRLANVIAPAIGAFILITGGKLSLTITSIVVFALSIVPLYKMRHVRDTPPEKVQDWRQVLSHSNEKRNFFSLALWGIHTEAEDTLWPLFIFFVIGTLQAVAAIPVVVSVTTIVFSFLAGKLSNNHSKRMMIVGSSAIAVIWILRIVFNDPTFYYVTIFLVGMLSLLVSLPLDRGVTTYGLRVSPLAASTYRNTASMSLRALLYLVLLLLVEVFKVSFALASLSLFVILATIVLFKQAEETALEL